jgi:succinoglycan biosynthesis transport protein ExoP
VLRRRWTLIVACAVIGAVAALAYSVTHHKEYTASASLWFHDPGFDQKLFGSNFLPSASDPQEQQATNVDLAALNVVAARTASAIGHGLTAGAVAGALTTSALGTSDIVRISATAGSPALAATLATTAAQQFVAYRRESDQSTIQQALQSVKSDISQEATNRVTAKQTTELRQLQDELQVLSSLQTGNVQLVQPASVPTSPSSPRTLRNGILGLVLGLLIGLSGAFALERLDRRFRDQADVERVLGLPVLASVPQTRLNRGTRHGVGPVPVPYLEAFGLLRANLRYFNVDREIRSVLVASSTPGEGKTTVAWSLAASTAASGRRAIVVEADMRRPTMRTILNVEPSSGLSEVLSRQTTLSEAIVQAEIHHEHAGVEPTRFDVLTSGALPPNPSQLLESSEMTEALASLTEQYDLVVIDTPPLAVVSDAIPLVTVVSGVIVVACIGQTRRDLAVRLRAQLYDLGAPVLGVVANRVASRSLGSSYAYYYAPSAGVASE